MILLREQSIPLHVKNKERVESKMEQEAQILRIEKISPNDGNGLRTVVFFKGCPLRCAWCSTPESQNRRQELYYKKEKCVSCGTCIKTCEQNALSYHNETKKIEIDRGKCNSCFACSTNCLSGALGVYGEKMTVKQVMKHILKDEIFYFHSGGGVTLSGGDVLCQSEFAQQLLKECKNSGIHTMAELDMFGDYANVERLLPYLDSFYIDIKLMNEKDHQKWTGVSNRTILENTKRAAKKCKPGALHIRVPLIKGVNDTRSNIQETAKFCKSLSQCSELEFLPYHRLGQSTYESTGREYSLKHLAAMSFEEAYERVAFLKKEEINFPIKISGKTINLEDGNE